MREKSECYRAIEEKLKGVRSLERWPAPLFPWDDVEAFTELVEIPEGIHSFIVGDNLLDIYINVVENTPAFVYFHPNCPRAPDFMLPVFSGFGVTESLGSTLVVPSDPTLHLSADLALAWHAGTLKNPLQKAYRKILSHVLLMAGAPYSVFWGGSGGGFAALYYSWFFEDSIAFVWNPQTDLLKYDPPGVLAYLKVAFGVEAIPGAEETVRKSLCHDLVELYGKGHANRVVYLQNSTDWHVEVHLAPFLKALGHGGKEEARAHNGMLGGAFYLYLDKFSENHDPPPDSAIKSALETLLATDGDLKAFDFARCLVSR